MRRRCVAAAVIVSISTFTPRFLTSITTAMRIAIVAEGTGEDYVLLLIILVKAWSPFDLGDKTGSTACLCI